MLELIEFQKFGNESFNLDFELEFDKLNVFAGANGSGKSFLFKAAWFMGAALNVYQTIMKEKIPGIDELFEKEFNQLFDLTFTESDKLSGVIRVSDKEEKIYQFTVRLTEGKLVNFDIKIYDPQAFGWGQIRPIEYNSREARTFLDYEKYRNMKVVLGVTELNAENLKKLGTVYRIYDMMWFEKIGGLIKHLEKNPDILARINPLIEKFSDGMDSITGMGSDESITAKDGIMYAVLASGELKAFHSLSVGEQSMWMLLITALTAMATQPGGQV